MKQEEVKVWKSLKMNPLKKRAGRDSSHIKYITWQGQIIFITVDPR